ncbi:T9SS type A sorting domain-containing protein [Flammeovirga aprica]|uniref:T9SS type A sorting domain-containing protein n=1 Tax=Flammeovirga aprica JL-4 TaxID=694437 RepID=A0A7X9XB24_9BACT|nr:T9SS type A sorting domain-containing protein [Flammeovirga aprica]NME70214.1 T9SS type A sorting domain-containing protein [Flammeovirga aprica JL-4]
MRIYKIIIQCLSIVLIANCNMAIGFAQNIYAGGSGEGDSFSGLSEGASPDVNVFLGGNGEGISSESLSSVVQTDPEVIYTGGISLGYSEGVLSASLPVTENFIFDGGDARGDASASIMVDDFADLPVELRSFDVFNVDGEALVKWETLWEINNDYFVVEKSRNRRNWEEVEQVKGYGNSNYLLSYEVKDENPLSGLSYYRLKQVDFDGTATYSEIKAFSTDKTVELELVAYPNPLQDQLTILVRQAYHNRMQLFTITGQRVDFRIVESEEERIKIALPNLEKGMYVLRVASVGALVLMK